MGFNVDRIKVTLTINVDFSTGAHDATFEFVPTDDDPLRAALLERWHQIRDAQWQEYIAAAKADPANPTITM